ncbi:uncharacterized protein LOC105645849 isoform X3 [Jatropha curcas]|uniref:uncharacterized protein LOC105645849 isoform X3 n=1 Tax=Jatropha curcas TaxID=180498 RepID=UPI0005FA96FC|nr:uncharacterized protein LOC105645849 isoform X3 [Jatropha curcas]
MTAEYSPEELPHGWTVQFNVLKTGRKIKYYLNSGTGQKYFSTDDFIRYFRGQGTQLDQHHPSKSLIGLPSKKKQQLIEYANERPEWLPNGWVVELKTRKSGDASGKVYKCYVDPSTGCKFYSKPAVVRYLETIKQRSYTPKQKETLKSALPTSEVKFEKSTVDDLPPGWIKEIKITANANGIRKDPYYIDPIKGYVFRSKRDVERYLETGKISKHAFLPKKRHTGERILPSPAAKRQKVKHPAHGQQLLTGKGRSDVDSRTSSEADSLRKSRGKSVTSVTMLPVVGTLDRPSQKSPRDNVMDNDVKYKENSNRNFSAPTKAEVSRRNQDKRTNVCDGYGLLIPKGNNEQGQSLESEISRDESSKRKTENSLCKSSGKKWFNLPRRSSRRLAGIEPELVDNSLLVQANSEADNKQGQNSYESAIKGDESYKRRTHTSKADNKRGLLPCRSSKRLAGIEPELVANSVSIVQALPKTIKSPKIEAILAVGLKSDVLADKKCDQIQAESITQILDHSSSNADNPLLEDTSKKNPKYDTTCSVLSEANVSKRNQCEMVSAVDKPVLTPTADTREEENSLESGAKGRGQGKIQNILIRTSNKKGINLPRRSSKRLAGLEPELAANSESSAQAVQNAKTSCRSESIQAASLTSDALANKPSQPLKAEPRTDFTPHALTDFSNSLTGELSSQNQVSIHGQAFSKDQSQVLKTDKTNNEKSEPQLIPPFGEFLSDPCLEFAFKTLTGEIPVEIAADNGQVSTPAADIIDERKFLVKKTDKSVNGKILKNSGKYKKNKKLHLPHQSPEQLLGLEQEPTASLISNQLAFKTKGRKSSKTEAFLDMGLAADNLAMGAYQQFKDGTKAECVHHQSANVNSVPQIEPSSNRVDHLNDIANEEHSRKLEIEKNVNKPEQQPIFSFADYWSDPCFEFAFKTLTGAIPIEDNLPVQNYLQQQVDTSQTQRDGYFPQRVDSSQTFTDGSLALPDYGLPSFFQTDISVHFDAPEKQLTSQPQVPLNNPCFLPSGNVSLPTCSSIGSQQPERLKENKGLRGKVNS